VKSAEGIMNILEAYDLRDAGELADCSHHTVARYVRAREEGWLVPGAGIVDRFQPKLEALVERSKGRIHREALRGSMSAGLSWNYRSFLCLRLASRDLSDWKRDISGPISYHR
jgi:hypothetical protein